ncbi:MAG: ribonuclease R [Clostridia bacterium]
MNFDYRITEKIEKLKIDGLNCRQIAKSVGFEDNFDVQEVKKILNRMVKQNKLIKKENLYFSVTSSSIVQGVLRGNKRGFAFLIPDDKTVPDIFIPHSRLNTAMHGDTVTVKILRGDEGEVVDVIKRGMTEIVGTYQKQGLVGFVIPDDFSYNSDLFIPPQYNKNIKNNTKVVAKIINYGAGKNPEAKIIEVIGDVGDRQSDVLSILKSYGFFNIFSAKALMQAREATNPQSFEGREDLRDLLTMTIDGDDSKDLDDAISLFKKGNRYTLFVHIADVSNFVPMHSELDKEALKRATSVYFPNAVYPMLPKELSNGICSLNENEDRLALTVKMIFDENGSIIDHTMMKSVVKNNYRMTYTNVTKILAGEQDLCAQYKEIVPMLNDMQALANLLNKIRRERGSINFDTKESKIILNEDGTVKAIEPYPYTISNGIIEEFMLITNETVAKHMFNLKLPFVYRVHEKPDAEKIENFATFVAGCGFNFNKNEVTPMSFQKLLDAIAESPKQTIISKIMLRSMKKAKYMPQNLGHFGLAADYYCHFTSPIRRYPDLMIHRIIKWLLDGELNEKMIARLTQELKEISDVSSEREMASESAERDIDDYYKVEYMQQHIGKQFAGVVSGVTSFGIFVELENTCEGIVRLEDLPKDNYVFYESKYMVKGAKYEFSLGQSVTIEVVQCDIEGRRVSFKIIAD